MKNINKKLIKSTMGEVMYERGMDYFEDGKVLNIIHVENVVKAEVEGTRPQPYKVKIVFDGNNMRSSCSCPYDATCKHIAAVLFALEKERKKQSPKINDWQMKLAKLSKEELIKILTPLVETDHDFKMMILNKLGDKIENVALEKYHAYWEETSDLLENFQRYGGGSDTDAETIDHNLNELVVLLKKSKLHQQMRREFIENVLDYYFGGNSGLDDTLMDAVFSAAKSKDDWRQIVKRLKTEGSDYDREIVMTIYKRYLHDKNSYLEERTKKLKYGLDYYDLVGFYEKNRNKEKALQTALEGVKKGEGRKIDLYEYLFKHYQKRKEHENAMKYLKKIFQDKLTLIAYKSLIAFSNNKESDAQWALSCLKKHSMWDTIAKIDYYEKRYDLVLKYVMSKYKNSYFDIFDGRDELANKLKEHYPCEIIEFYKRKVEKAISRVNKKGYYTAADYIKKIKHIYRAILKQENVYEKYISALREQHAKRPAFLDAIKNL